MQNLYSSTSYVVGVLNLIVNTKVIILRKSIQSHAYIFAPFSRKGKGCFVFGVFGDGLTSRIKQLPTGVNVLLKVENYLEIRKKKSEIFHFSKHRFLLDLIHTT